MLNQYSGLQSPSNSQTHVILVQSQPTFNQEMSQIRNYLRDHNIRYEEYFEFAGLQDRLQNLQQNTKVLINNRTLHQKKIPSFLYDKYRDANIYFFPKQNSKGTSLKNFDQVLAKLKGNGQGSKQSNPHKIKLKSFKKMIEKNEGAHKYEELLIHSDFNSQSSDYVVLFELLKNENLGRIIKAQNQLVQGNKSNKSKALLITSSNSVNRINQYLVEERKQKYFDFAVLGFKKQGQLNIKNIAILTDNPEQILRYLEENGFDCKNLYNQYYRTKNNQPYQPYYHQKFNHQAIQSPNPHHLQAQSDYSAVIAKTPINKQSSYTNQGIISDIPMARVMYSKGESQENITDNHEKSQTLHDSKKIKKIDTSSDKKKPQKIKKINKSSIINSSESHHPQEERQQTNMMEQKPDNEKAGFLLEEPAKVLTSHYNQKKQIMNWDVFVPKGENNHVTVQTRQNPSISSVGKPKSENIFSDLNQQSSQNSLKQSENKQSYIPGGVIYQVSDEYRGSNRQSYIGQEQPKNYRYGSIQQKNIIVETPCQNNVFDSDQNIGQSHHETAPHFHRSSNVLTSVKQAEKPKTISYNQISNQQSYQVSNNRISEGNLREDKRQIKNINTYSTYKNQSPRPVYDNRSSQNSTRILNKATNVGPSTYVQQQSNKYVDSGSYQRVENTQIKADSITQTNMYQKPIIHQEIEDKRKVHQQIPNPVQYNNNEKTNRYIDTRYISDSKKYVISKPSSPHYTSQSRFGPENNGGNYILSSNYHVSSSRYYNGKDPIRNGQRTNTYTQRNQINSQSRTISTPDIQKKQADLSYQIKNIKQTSYKPSSYQIGSSPDRNSNYSHSPSQTKTPNSQPKILSSHTFDLDKYEKTIDENGRVVYISKDTKKENSPSSTRVVQNNYQRQSASTTKIINNNGGIIGQKRQYIQTSVSNDRPDQRSYGRPNVEQKNYSYRKEIGQKNYGSPHQQYYQQSKSEKISYDPNKRVQSSTKVYTREQYQAKYMNGNQSQRRILTSQKYMPQQPKPQIKGDKKDHRYSYNMAGTIQRNQKSQHNMNSYSTNNMIQTQKNLQSATKLSRYYSPNSQQQERTTQLRQYSNYPSSPENNKEYKRISTLVTESKTKEEKPIQYSENLPQVNIMSQRQVDKKVNKSSEKYHDYESSSNSSGIVKNPKFINYNNSISDYDKRVIKQNSSIRQNIQNSDNDHKIQQYSHNERQGLPIIYVQSNHKDLPHFIQQTHPNKFNIKTFRQFDELSYDRNAVVMLHPDMEFNGQNMPVREFESVYMLGNTNKVPSGTVRIDKKDLQFIL